MAGVVIRPWAEGMGEFSCDDERPHLEAQDRPILIFTRYIVDVFPETVAHLEIVRPVSFVKLSREKREQWDNASHPADLSQHTGEDRPVGMSVVDPVKDGGAPIERLTYVLRTVFDERSADDTVGIGWELIFVDDGRRDHNWEATSRWTKPDARVRGVRLRRNFGQSASSAVDSESSTRRIIAIMCEVSGAQEFERANWYELPGSVARE